VDTWRWEATASVICVGMVLLWVVSAGMVFNTFWSVWLAVGVGAGIGFGISGSRRGSRISRSVAQGSLLLHVVFALLLPAIARGR
jgi:hypothetical protein